MSEPLSWVPEPGDDDRYCAPACGRGCTVDEFLAADREARLLTKHLHELTGDRNWTARVNENFGWFASVEHTGTGIRVSRKGDRWIVTNAGPVTMPKGCDPTDLEAVFDAFGRTCRDLADEHALRADTFEARA